MSAYLVKLGVLVGIAIGLLVLARFIRDWRTILIGLSVNLLAAAVLLVIEQQQSVPLPDGFFWGGLVALALTLPFFVLRNRTLVQRLDSLTGQLHEAQQNIKTVHGAGSAITRSGLILYSRNFLKAFARDTSRDFSDYARQFVTTSQPGSRYKIIGIDWTELFGAAISATSERYFELLNDRRTVFSVILLDPRSRVAFEKRFSEFALSANGKLRYIQNFPTRISEKIIGAATMISDYHARYPNQFTYRFIGELPMCCAILNGQKALFYLYSRCHKGWDSPVFVAENVPEGIYGFIEEYFDFLWANPLSVMDNADWIKIQDQMKARFQEFERIVQDACSGDLHKNCARAIM